MLEVKIFPKEKEREWYMLNFQGSHFKWSDALTNGIKLYTYSLTGIEYKYKDKAEKIEVIN
jgi:hypothetical protein